MYKVEQKEGRSGDEPIAVSMKEGRPFRNGPLPVGVTGFEPATTCTPCKCATGLRYTPK